ncbi:MAG: HDOD domain-containing protein [Opitutaceae bacterium]|nr:HDOD domain-containing protein [Opitutaceae bacterium]
MLVLFGFHNFRTRYFISDFHQSIFRSQTNHRCRIARRACKLGIRTSRTATVASKIFTLTNNPNAEVGDLSQLIHSDQSMASHIMRIANSAIHGGGDQIVSLQQAVARLGMNLLGDIPIAPSLQGDLFKEPG